ncbi:YbfB/YjiJ family MFS transporter [Pararhizobium arenae]|uniref:YbfB/YjiJ family MFS transporter n=1 Tax=Pararhizobium arenae TaxID=1856850 RepID=UPI000ACF123C|nr:YbfB/YjiJ family MFS transporter [Pararhizobium arenae]
MTVAHSSAGMARTAAAGAIAMAIAMGFGRFAYTPILPGMMAGLGLSPSDAGLIASANFVGYLVGAVLAGLGWATGRERSIGLGALLSTALLLLAMGTTESIASFIVIRFLAGVASAFTMIFLSSIVLGRAARIHNPHVQAVHFGGVGLGIAASSLMIFLLAGVDVAGFASWRLDWLGSALIAFIGAIAVWLMLEGETTSATPVHEPPIVWNRPLVVMTLTYGLFGFGYVITATFLVAMAREGAADSTVEFLAWFLTGLSAAISIYLWGKLVRFVGLVGVYLGGLLVEAIGLVLAVSLPLPAAPLVGGVLLGLTFLMVTAFGLQIGRLLAPKSPRKALAFMTAAFGVGQIIGPIVAGRLAEGGGYTLPTLIAASVLLLCVVMVAVEARRISEAMTASSGGK